MTSDNLSQSLNQSWTCLIAGASPGKSRFSMVQIATIGLDGAPRARTVVIRSVDRNARRVEFNTDLRSPKIAELRKDARVTLIGYDMEAGQQVRIAGVAEIHNKDSVALAAWGATHGRSKVSYRVDHSPGDIIDAPTMAEPTDEHCNPSDAQLGFDRFCRVVLTVEEIDWLDLAQTGHRRARHIWSGDQWVSDWLAP